MNASAYISISITSSGRSASCTCGATWLPLTIDVYVQGREWLARRLTRAGVAYTPCDNCFTAIADFARAQRASDELTTLDWPTLLTAWARA